LQELTKDELSFNNIIRVLSSYELIEVAISLQELIELKGYSIYIYIHSWTIYTLN
ncbi:hypothetical protein BKA64DRAFT_570847, partial [Cadophora sp. MPI-SDFR-AT-0126]